RAAALRRAVGHRDAAPLAVLRGEQRRRHGLAERRRGDPRRLPRLRHDDRGRRRGDGRARLPAHPEAAPVMRPFNSLMLRLLMSLLRGSIALFGVYVVLHGHYAPGGGFVAGALFAAAMILPRLLAGGAEDPWMLAPRGALVLA